MLPYRSTYASDSNDLFQCCKAYLTFDILDMILLSFDILRMMTPFQCCTSLYPTLGILDMTFTILDTLDIILIFFYILRMMIPFQCCKNYPALDSRQDITILWYSWPFIPILGMLFPHYTIIGMNILDLRLSTRTFLSWHCWQKLLTKLLTNICWLDVVDKKSWLGLPRSSWLDIDIIIIGAIFSTQHSHQHYMFDMSRNDVYDVNLDMALSGNIFLMLYSR